MEHTIERAVLLCNGKILKELYLPSLNSAEEKTQTNEYVIKPFGEQERDYIMYVLERCNWKIFGKGGAAQILDLKPTTLISKMKKLGIKRKHVAE